MRKKIIGLLCLMIIISCSTIFGQNLITIIYDQQGNKYSLYDDHSWIMNDENLIKKTTDSQLLGTYIIKEDGLKDFLKIMLISQKIYPGTDEWLEYIMISNIGLGLYSSEDLMEIAELNIYLQINENQLKLGYKSSDSEEDFVLDRVTPSSGKLGFYLQNNNLFILNESGNLVNFGIFKDSNKFEINLTNLIDEFGEPDAMDDIEGYFTGYEKYLFITLEKE
ncbi:MAG: hypothetical protein WC162_04025 [Sphaerochaetaceae bacterium]